MKIFKKSVLLIFFILLGTSYSQYEINKNYLGASIGLSFLGSSPQLGLNYEYSLELNDFGMVGIGGIMRYWGYSENYLSGKWKYSNFVLGVQGNYHLKINDARFDPWAGLILAYNSSSVSWDGTSGFNYVSPSSGGLWIAVNAGTRFWLQHNLALNARVTFGNLSYGSLDIGIDYIF